MTLGRGRRILLVEDNPGDAELIVELLSDPAQSPDSVTRVDTLAAATSLLRGAELDAVLLDLRLPDASGVDCVAAIRSVAEAIPIVVLTGMDDDALALRCLRAGAQDYFSKIELRAASLRRAIDYAIVRMEESSQRTRADGLQSRLAAIVDAASDAIVSASLDGIVTSWNPAAERIFGVSGAEAIGAPAGRVLPLVAELVDEAARARVHEEGRIVLEGSQERTWRRSDGSAVILSVVASVLRAGSGEPVGVAATCRDVSAQRALETQLALSDRMVSIGTLAAGVAHEINNPLASLVANLELANQQLDEMGALPEPLNELADELRDAEEAATRVLRIVRDLKRLSRAEEEKTGPVDLVRAIESSLRIASAEVRQRARLVEIVGEIPLVDANEARLGQVLLNLLINAAQAIPEGNPEANEVRVETGVDERGRVTVRVSDTGIGIPPEARDRLFAAFYTTKPVGVGTGLGLAISRSIVMAFGGEISFESEVGKGTTFLVDLRPWTGATLEPARSKALSAPPKRRGKVLVIDDEPTLLRVIERILADAHDVTTTTSALEGLGWLREGRDYDVILCDLMMPAMSGAAFYEALRGLAGHLQDRVVFMTGGAFTTEGRGLLDSVPNRSLEKPFDVGRLRALVSELVA